MVTLTFDLLTLKIKGQGHQAGLLTAAFTQRQLQRSAWNVLSVGNCCYVAICRRGGRLGGARRYGAHRGGEGRGISCRYAHSLLLLPANCQVTSRLRSNNN